MLGDVPRPGISRDQGLRKDGALLKVWHEVWGAPGGLSIILQTYAGRLLFKECMLRNLFVPQILN